MGAKAHNIVVRETLVLLGHKACHIGRFFRNETGVVQCKKTNRYIRYGVNGSPDIYGIIQGGRYIAIEIKTGNAVQQKNQKNFEEMCKQFGALYFTCHSADEALQVVLTAAAQCTVWRE